MTHIKLDGPISTLVLLGLTLPEVSERDLAKIQAAAPPGSTIKVAPHVRDAIAMADDAEVILGFLPEPLFNAARRLRWAHAIASSLDMFLYPATRDFHVVLTGEKGLVGGHLADTRFGLLLALTRQIATAIRLGSDSWQERKLCAVKKSNLRA
jgi:phosphoglycerate dehydrogenase-like enzyme